MAKVGWFVGVFLIAISLLGVLSLLQGSIAEGFDANQNLQVDLAKMVKSVSSIGKKLLDPEMWNYRIQIMNLSPIELARKQIAQNNIE
jgi:Tfp pilus assembly protein PilV